MPGCNEASFRSRNLVDAVLVAARETVFTAALGWLLSDQSTLDGANRKWVLDRISGLDFGGCDEISYATEWKNLDLLITGFRNGRGTCSLAIETKLKSSESDGQLAGYDKELADLVPPVAKRFLTLFGDDPQSGQDWEPLSCANLLDMLTDVATTDRYLCDFRDALARLAALGECVRNCPELAASIFQRPEPEPTDDIGRYIKDFRLRTFAQRVWMTELGGSLQIPPPWVAKVRETNGEALLDVEASLTAGPGCRVGLELQHQSVKLFASPWPYIANGTDDQHRRVTELLEELGPHFGIPAGQQPTRARNRGFRSYTIMTLQDVTRNVQAYAETLQPLIGTLTNAREL